MSTNRKSRTMLKFTGISWGIKFSSKRDENSSKTKIGKLSKSQLNKTRFQMLIKGLDNIPEESVIKKLYEKFNSLGFQEKQSIRKSIKKRKTK
jgi:hypothetical protein